jgi:hypothetical protein
MQKLKYPEDNLRKYLHDLVVAKISYLRFTTKINKLDLVGS